MTGNDIFGKMIAEATEEVARVGWKNASQKAVTLASTGLQLKRMTTLVRPIYWLALVIAGGMVWDIFGHYIGV